MIGNYSVSPLRDSLHVMDREKAAAGVFITVDRQGRKPRAIAAEAGKRSVGADRGPRCVLLSIEEMFEDGAPALPTLADPRTGQALLV